MTINIVLFSIYMEVDIKMA